MKYCKSCNGEIPLKILVDGKCRNLQRRLYCLNCSPFGASYSARTSREAKKPDKPDKPCAICGLDIKPRRNRCNSCNTMIRRVKTKLKAILYLGGKCQHCGWNKHPAGFQFHHKDPSEKDFNIGAVSNRRWEIIQAELDKCELLCACCHAIHHTTKFDDVLLLSTAGIEKYWV